MQEQELLHIYEIRNKLLACGNIHHVVQTALNCIADVLNAQVISVFLFSKDGFLRRAGIRGTDKDKNQLTDSWYSDEQYEVGASFTGKAVLPFNGSTFGRPVWSVDLERDQIDARSKCIYKKTLGELNSAIAVPLNGRHRTFGVLEVINKVDQHGNLLKGEEGAFSYKNVYWLSIIGMNLATAITSLRRKNELDTQTEVSRMLVEPVDPNAESQPLYNYTVERLVKEPSFFKACILRIGEHANAIGVVARAGDGISWEKRIDESRKRGLDTLTGQIYTTGKPIFIEDIEPRKYNFKNIEWIEANNLRSYAGFPLKVEFKTVGTLSIFLGFPYKFYQSDIDYVSNITYLLAAFTRNIISAKEINTLNAEMQREKEEIYSRARGIAYTREVEEVMHEYKNELLTFLHALEESEKSSPGRRSQIIQERIGWTKKRLEEIKKSFVDAAEVPVDINRIVRAVRKVFNAEHGRTIRFLYDYEIPMPEIMAVEAEIRDVVFNLISNAVKAIEKAGRKQGTIKLSTQIIEEGDIEYIQLCVDDNGVGIRNEDEVKIYQRGFTTYRGGTGMGLYIARKIVEAYGGKITFTSTVGKGSKFCVKIPLKRNQAWEDS